MKSRAAILHDVGGPWSIEEFELDPPRAGEVLVQMAAAGLCHSDDHILKGDMAAPNEVLRAMGLPTMFPTIGGHEGSGIVREVGDGVTDFEPGDHVVMSFVAVCGQCRWCATGMEYLCDAGIGTLTPGMPTDGTFRHHLADGKPLGHISKIGAFAEHTVVATNSLVKVEPDLPLLPGALLSCAIPTGYGSAANRAGVRGGDTVKLTYHDLHTADGKDRLVVKEIPVVGTATAAIMDGAYSETLQGVVGRQAWNDQGVAKVEEDGDGHGTNSRVVTPTMNFAQC